MSDVVILLGAGASKESGAPLMADFLDAAEDLLRTGKAGSDKGHFDSVFKAIGALKPATAQFALDIDNLESVFSALEMAAVVGRLGDLAHEEIEAARTGMRRVITRTLQERMLFPIAAPGQASVLDPTPSYRDFANSILGILQNTPRLGPPSIISLNYDLAVEVAFRKHGIAFDYG